jgi:hypothetical protein
MDAPRLARFLRLLDKPVYSAFNGDSRRRGATEMSPIGLGTNSPEPIDLGNEMIILFASGT